MKYVLRDGIQVDTFSDGEMVIYDQNHEMTHVLNQTAAMALNAILEKDDGSAKECFIESVLGFDPNVPVTVLQNDFDNILNDFLKADFVTAR